MPIPLIAAAGIIGVGTAATFKLLASGAEDAGQAVDAAGSGVLKLAIAAGGTFILMKQMKVI
ncbi:MAG: hypothetical protein ACRBDL_03385 [Alphaproteobacteria bacterium]